MEKPPPAKRALKQIRSENQLPKKKRGSPAEIRGKKHKLLSILMSKHLQSVTNLLIGNNYLKLK